MTDSPFAPSHDSLRDVLRRDFVRRAATWLLGNRVDQVLAQVGDSAWEAAMTLLFLARARHAFQASAEYAELCTTIERTSPKVALWLLDRRQIDSPSGQFHWEGVTWDTAVAVRCLLEMVRQYPQGFSAEQRSEILQTAASATKWLCRRFGQWEVSVKYPFGPADVAQILITLLYAADQFPDVYQEATKDTPETPAAIVRYLLRTKTGAQVPTFHADDNSTVFIEPCWWDDYFNTAEVLEALGSYYSSCLPSGATPDLLMEVRKTIIGACTYLEHTQCDGMWGSHIDTIRILQAYVELPHLVHHEVPGQEESLLVPEPHIVFKALRWMCDEKQVFHDGSMLHTLFLTVFYAHTIMEVHDSWAPAQRTIDLIYDDVLWATPVRTTPERFRRLGAEIRLSAIRHDLADSSAREKQLNSELRGARHRTKTVLVTAVIVFISVPLGTLISGALDFSELSFKVLDGGNLLQLVSVVGALVALLIGAVWTLEKILLQREVGALDDDEGNDEQDIPHL